MTEADYFEHLERRVSRELAGMRQRELRSISYAGFRLEKIVVTESGSHVAGRVWMDDGSGDQTLWNFVLLLGPTPVERDAVRWGECLPGEDTTGWLYLDFDRQFLKIKLSAAHAERSSGAVYR